jgi:cell wall-associated NlpC family hydrolase
MQSKDFNMDIQEIRNNIVAEAKSWLGTPYLLNGKIKGAGCDCATLILMVMSNCKLFTADNLGIYRPDWWQHKEEEVYLFYVMRHAKKILETTCRTSTKVDPGNIILGKVANSKIYNHGCIVTSYPYAIHSVQPKVKAFNLLTDPLWAMQNVIIFDPIK